MIRRLSIFTRYPVAGLAKTRLIPALGEQGAADLHDRMTRQVIDQARGLALPAMAVEVCFAGADSDAMRRWLGDDLRYVPQDDGDLGQRMLAVFVRAATEGVAATVLIGTDLPDLRADHLARAFDALARHDLVLGPATDGGYYLIGLRQPLPSLFDGVAWSTAAVLDQTLDRAKEAGLTVALIDRLRDVDRPEDL